MAKVAELVLHTDHADYSVPSRQALWQYHTGRKIGSQPDARPARPAQTAVALSCEFVLPKHIELQLQQEDPDPVSPMALKPQLLVFETLTSLFLSPLFLLLPNTYNCQASL